MTREKYGATEVCQRELARRLADGDPSAPKDMIEAYYPELYRYARSMLRNPTLAEDVVHDAFVSALEALGKYRAERVRELAIRAWLYRITLNRIRDHFRKSARRDETALFDESVPSDDTRDSDGVMDVLDALTRLPEKQRVAVVLRHMQDLPYAEISVATGWPENTAKTLVRRGMLRLREDLSAKNEEEETR